MAYYFAINGYDFSPYINELKVSYKHKYNSLTNAAGDTVVDLINNKRTIEVGIIPVDSEAMKFLSQVLGYFEANITYRDPIMQTMETCHCACPTYEVSYYTIQKSKVMYKGFKLKFQEL